MNFPALFINKIVGAFGEDGKAWLETLETRIQKCAEKWELRIERPVSNLSYNYVIKAVDSKENPVILKLGVPNFEFNNEIKALQAYDGNGFVKLIESDAELGAILQEQLLPGTMLSKEEELSAIHYFIQVWKAIRRPLPSGLKCPSIANWALGIDRYIDVYPDGKGPISDFYINLAKECFNDISKTSKGPELLHGDLHHENILYSTANGWTAIDPKGVSGDPYFDLISFLINHLHNNENPKELLKNRVNILCRELDLNRERLLKAAIALSVLYACWGIEDSDPDWMNTYVCAQWFQQFRTTGVPNL